MPKTQIFGSKTLWTWQQLTLPTAAAARKRPGGRATRPRGHVTMTAQNDAPAGGKTLTDSSEKNLRDGRPARSELRLEGFNADLETVDYAVMPSRDGDNSYVLLDLMSEWGEVSVSLWPGEAEELAQALNRAAGAADE